MLESKRSLGLVGGDWLMLGVPEFYCACSVLGTAVLEEGILEFQISGKVSPASVLECS